MKKNLETREGFENRHLKPLPQKSCIMFVIIKDSEGERIHLCKFIPYNENYMKEYTSDGYLGTAHTIDRAINIGFYAWEQNNDEFTYYKIVEYPKL